MQGFETAGSSLLYSREFYEVAKEHLKPNGILQAWFPMGDAVTFQAVLRSLLQSFPHVRCFQGVGRTGTHLLASMEPIERRKGAELVSDLPPKAKEDLCQWSSLTPAESLDQVLAEEFSAEKLLDTKSNVLITDDQPYNEYFLLRRLGLLDPWR